MKLKLSALSLSIMALVVANTAQAVQHNGTITVNVPTADVRGNIGRVPVKLMRVKLSEEELNVLNNPQRMIEARTFSANTDLPVNAEVSLISTVLDQGQHGSCVTFAVTGALDALIGKGDYVSQLCSLELGSYLEQRSYMPSGWDGSDGSIVLNQLLAHGIVTTAKQKVHSCAGVTRYPASSESNIGSPMSLDDYHFLSEDITFNKKSPYYIYWEQILSDEQFYSDDYDADKIINEVKKNLATTLPRRQVRLTLGALLPVEMCDAGACGSYQSKNDTWALTRSMKRKFSSDELGGHEVIIFGYDDDAVVVDSEGGKHRGVFKLRNSWGPTVGDKGDYYMTYDFFKRFATSVERIVKVNRKGS